MSKGVLVILDGNVGVGKTTTLKALSAIRSDLICYEESFAKECPYLNELYSCMNKDKCITLSLQTQCWILNKTIGIFEEAVDLVRQGKIVVLDRSIFGMSPFITSGIKADMLCKSWGLVVEKEISRAMNKLWHINHFIIHLRARPETIMKRIQSRPDYIPPPERSFDSDINLTLNKITSLCNYYRQTFEDMGSYTTRVQTLFTDMHTVDYNVEKICNMIDSVRSE